MSGNDVTRGARQRQDEDRPLRPRLPDFLIVGSARSGTTLVQRLACELPDVMVPVETHFFDLFLDQMLARGGPPYGRSRTRDELLRWSRLPEVDADLSQARALPDTGASRILDVFAAALGSLTSDSFGTIGEKTPNHLFYWKPLRRALPDLRWILVVRDPRAVVSSVLATPWGPTMFHPRWGEHLYVAIAERWRFEQEQASVLATAAGSRCLSLRFEDVVADPRSTRVAIAHHLGVKDADPRARQWSAPTVVSHPWETWKRNATDVIDPSRTSAWRTVLPPRAQRNVTAICEQGMREWGYLEEGEPRGWERALLAARNPLTHARRRQYRSALVERQRHIDRLAL